MAQSEKFRFVGHYNCLDFVNTRFTKEGDDHVDSLHDCSDVLEWLWKSGRLNRAQLQRALKLWGSGHGARRIFRSALALREALFSMAEKLAAQRPVPRASLDAINGTMSKRPGCVLHMGRSGRFEELTCFDLDEPDHLTLPIAQSASDLLCHGDLTLLKRCANPVCGVFFYDTSKNHTRRWCSTAECGNRMRVAAHYRRRQAAG